MSGWASRSVCAHTATALERPLRPVPTTMASPSVGAGRASRVRSEMPTIGPRRATSRSATSDGSLPTAGGRSGWWLAAAAASSSMVPTWSAALALPPAQASWISRFSGDQTPRPGGLVGESMSRGTPRSRYAFSVACRRTTRRRKADATVALTALARSTVTAKCTPTARPSASSRRNS